MARTPKPGDFAYEQTRFAITNGEIAGEHVMYGGDRDEQIMRRNGYLGPFDFWEKALSESMTVGSFVSLLYHHSKDPERMADEGRGQVIPIETLLRHALKQACREGESWIAGVTPDGFSDDRLINPISAVEWFYLRPKKRDLLPKTLLQVLSKRRDGQTSDVPRGGGKRGPKPTQGSRIEAEMRALAPQDLKGMKQEDMVRRFGAARSTCEAVRRRVLSTNG
ncbi:hypothetical protein [Mesorhizobium sangaii]|uniref:Uncharacterized protein n=1 Tax=Mesorhizobium sangaii TaxID=505389 RepID=A0A841PLH7_9HYPH|nr:hypothetical protein [Mesorhizobium sangaii]MBB6413518.1 hypothetical protein [Mesorhizobium sangaii]